ncbi:DsbA family protein [Alphaproteobacteria bacterium]|nr:DsbA family protein [Alphaproteobacteria bacterium]
MKKILSIICLLFITSFASQSLLANEISGLEITENDFTIGDENAPITIIEYASMSCSHCADFHNNTLPDLKTEYIDTGKVRMVFRDYPFNYPALLGSMMLRCIPEDVKYDYMNALYQLQATWVNRDPKVSKKELYKIMQSGGMTKDEFDACYGNLDNENLILEGVMAAQKDFNVKSTPTFVINGNLIEGNKNIKEFRQIIDKILSQ